MNWVMQFGDGGGKVNYQHLIEVLTFRNKYMPWAGGRTNVRPIACARTTTVYAGKTCVGE